MKVSKNAYYHWLNQKRKTKPISAKELLKLKIKRIFNESKSIYGSCRIQKMLEREGVFYSRSYISLLMKEMGLRSVLKRKFVVTTNSNHSFKMAENVLNRDFTTLQIGQKWVSDITYIRVKDNWNYLTTVIDLADRKVVGWSLSEDMTTENTVLKAWINARKNRKIASNHIFHSDRGVQYASNKMTNIFSYNIRITQSMSRKEEKAWLLKDWDNAVAESFFKTIKYECLYRYKFESYEQLFNCTNEYIEWYNTKRIHSSLGYLTPLEMEMKIKGKLKKIA